MFNVLVVKLFSRILFVMLILFNTNIYCVDIPKSKELFTKHAYNIFSQFGEDGIIQKIFEIIGTTSKVAIEFGACDGLHLSNTANLWKNQKWKGILIESDLEAYRKLVLNTQSYDCISIHAHINTTDHSLDMLLKRNNILQPIDLLSIDIDGNDYYILESLKCNPRVIICEYNPTIPVVIDMYAAENNFFGCSAGALVRIAEKKGYKAVALTECNIFFVLAEEFDKFVDYETCLKNMQINTHIKYLITSYCGEYLVVNDSGEMTYGIRRPYFGKLHGNFHKCNMPQ